MSVINHERQAATAHDTHRDVRVTRWVATIAGLIGFVLSVATPLLPVVQTTAMLNWPQNGQLNSVTAPLISLSPVDLTATVPCSAVGGLPRDGGVVLSTAPKKGKDAALNALFVVANRQRVDVTDRNVVIASVPRDQAMSAQCQHIDITSTRAGTFATFVGLTDSAGKPVSGGFPDPNLRPQIVGVFTDLTGPAPPGLRLSATIDTRFSTTPTTLKLVAMVLAIVATIVALVALWRLDQLDGRRMHRLIPKRWRKFTLIDATVIFGFLLWHLIGANSSDDGYILGMARVAGHAGYMSNYFRWFGSPEDPFGWYYNLLALMTHVSDGSLWMRLPDLVAGLVCWLLLSREVLPRLGPAVTSSTAANWAAGMVLLAAMDAVQQRPSSRADHRAGLAHHLRADRALDVRFPDDAGGAGGSDRRIHPRGAAHRPNRCGRIGCRWPSDPADPGAQASTGRHLAAGGPDAGCRLRHPHRGVRRPDPVNGVGSHQDSHRDRAKPGLVHREPALLLPHPAHRRRFTVAPVRLPDLLAVPVHRRVHHVAAQANPGCGPRAGVAVDGRHLRHHVLPDVHADEVGAPLRAVRRGGRGDGRAHHRAGLAEVLRWSRNRMAFVAAVLFVLALCFATTNGWWYVSSYGVPFNNVMPRLAGVSISTMFFVLFAIAAVWAFFLHFASPDHGEGRLARAVTAAPVPIAAGFMVLVFIASMVAGIVRQYPTYSNGWANLREFAGGCALADDVLVEPDSNAGFMAPLPGNYGPLGPLGGVNPVGFTPNGVPDHTVAEAVQETSVPQPGTDYDWYAYDWRAPTKLKAPGVNGSLVPLPYGLNPDQVPLAGSYTTGAQQQSRLASAWYQLPKPDDGHPLLVVTAAGKIAGNSVLHGHTGGQTVVLEYGKPGPGGDIVPAGRMVPYDLNGEEPKAWRNLRFARDKMPADATAVRVVAEDLSLTPDDWIAVTPPRVPELRSLQEYIGSSQPVLMDWAVGLAFPCQHPMLHANGVTEIPKFRITPDYNAKKQDTDTWEDGVNGGLLGITDLLLRAHVMSTYLSRDWGRDWGSLRKFDTVADAHPAQLDLGTATRSGWWSPGQIRIKP